MQQGASESAAGELMIPIEGLAGCSPRHSDARSRCARNPPCARLHLREAATPEPLKRKTRRGGRVCISGKVRNSRTVILRDFPTAPIFASPFWRAPEKCAQSQPLLGGLRCN